MKKIILLFSVVAVMFSCQTGGYQGGGNATRVVVNQPSNDVYVTPSNANVGQNLDLQALGELVKMSQSAPDLENRLNASGSINNLDLDGDGQVDYISVTEYGDQTTKGFSFTVQMPNNEQQEVATVELQQNNQQVVMNINGNSQVYGSGSYYSSNYLVRDLMIMNYLAAVHSVYHSPYHRGYYPSGYHTYSMSPYSTYNSRVKTVTKTSKIVKTTTYKKSTIKDPNSGYSSKSFAAERVQAISNPTSSQKSFAVRTDNSKPNTSGFGNKKSNSNSNSTSSYGSSKSSFGSSSKSSSGSSSFFSSSKPTISSKPTSSFSSSNKSSSGNFGSSSKSSSGGFGSSNKSSSGSYGSSSKSSSGSFGSSSRSGSSSFGSSSKSKKR